MDKNKLQQFIQAAKKQGLSDNEINAYVSTKVGTAQQPRQQSNTGNFITNLPSDVMSNVSGIAAIPGVIGNILTGKLPLGDTAGAVAKGIIDDYSRLAPIARTDTGFKFAPEKPISEFNQRPLSTVLNLLPFLGAGKNILTKLGGVGRATTTVGKVGKVGEVGDILSDVSRVGKTVELAGEGATATKGLDVIGNILKKAEKPAALLDEPSQLAKNIYQGVLNFSKKNNAFERLKPNETVGAMIKYGISGGVDEIAEKAAQVTGRRGILSNVVNNAIADTASVVDIKPINKAISELEGVYSALDKSKIDEVSKRLNKLSPGKKIGTVDASKILDFERQLQVEASKHRIAGLKGDTAAAELADFKTKLAGEIGDALDNVVKEKGNLDKYKDPRIIAALQKISPKLADEFVNTKTISGIRSLQKPFVRMGQILEVSSQEASSLGRNLFRGASQIPIVGNILDAAASNVAVPLATKTATAISSPFWKSIAEGAGMTAKGGVDFVKGLTKGAVSAVKRPETYMIGRSLQQPQTGSLQLDEILKTGSQTEDDKQEKQYKISDAQMMQVMLSPKISQKTKDSIEKAYKLERSSEGQSGVGKMSAKDVALSKGGMRSTNEAFRMLKEDPNLLAKSIIPGRPISRKYDAATYNAADSILRLRTGAVANKQEIEATQQRLFPWIGDDAETIAYKVQQLQNIFGDYLPAQ